MVIIITINANIFDINDEQSKKTYCGANQLWYNQNWQRTSGCGPTTYANIIHYLLQTRADYGSKININSTNKTGFINLMDDIWNIVTPGPLGIYSVKRFSKRVIDHSKNKDITLNCNIIKISAFSFKRPTKFEISEFLTKSLENNIPVAFLNRSNGKESRLPSWHWTTIIGFSPDDMKVEILDNGNRYFIDIGLWASTTILGGGLVSIQIN